MNNEPCMARYTLIDLNLVELDYYLFMVCVIKCNGSCNIADDLSTKIFVPSETKDLNGQVFNIITRTNEAKTLVKHTLCDCKCKFNIATCNLNQKWNNGECQCEYKKYCTCEKIIVRIVAHVFVRIVGI